MLLLFWDCDGLLLEHYFEQGTTITAASCTEMLKAELKLPIHNARRGVLSKGFLYFTITRIRIPQQPLFQQSAEV
jgi:hypothetical protein